MNFLQIDHRAFWGAFAIHMWQSALVVAVLLLLDRLLRGAPARLRGYLWWIGLLKLMLPVSLLASWAAELLTSLSAPTASVTVTTAVRGLRAVFEPQLWTVPAPRFAGDDVVYQLLTVAWLFGALAVAVALWRRRSTLVRQLSNQATAPLSVRLGRVASHYGVDPARIEVVDEPIIPSLVGLWRPRILLPRSLCEALTASQLGAVVAHEDAHRRLGHPLQRIVALPVLVTFYFFPVAWLVLARLHRAAELACDEAVLRAGVDARTYSQALARTLRLGFVQGAGDLALLVPSKSVFAARLRHIHEIGRPVVMTRHRLALTLAVITFTVSVVAGAFGTPQGAGSGEPSLPQARRLAAQAGLEADFPHLLELRGGGRQANVEFENRLLRDVLEQLAGLGGFELDTSQLGGSRRVTLVARNSTVVATLASLARSADLWFTVEDRRRLVVHEVVSIADRQRPTRTHYVAPRYPEQARDDRIQGEVVLESVIGLDGRMERIVVTGSAHPLLDVTARESVEQWRYAPVIVGGQPVKTRLMVTVQFFLQSLQ